jgi:tripartite-type tricarboxylate transporter receptor subunit TctC
MQPSVNFARLFAVCLAALSPSAIGSAGALDYPTRPVRWIVTYPPGGGTDITARIMAQWLSERLGQQFFIENKPGAGNNIGTEAAIHSPPDGYTLLLVNPANAINATLYPKLSFNFLRDIAEALPDVPTVAEAVPGYEASAFYGMGVPKGTPPEIIDKLNKEINAGLANPNIKARLAELGGMLTPGTPADFRKVGQGDQGRRRGVGISGQRRDAALGGCLGEVLLRFLADRRRREHLRYDPGGAGGKRTDQDEVVARVVIGDRGVQSEHRQGRCGKEQE